jgi:ribosome maturation factor RimP
MYVSREKESAETLFFVPDARACAPGRTTAQACEGGGGVYAEHFEAGIRDAIQPLLAGMGFSLVEISAGRRKGSTVVSLVIYRKEGVGVEQCAEVSSLVFPRLQTMEDLGDVSLEVSSPGIERVIRSPEEYRLFIGRGVRVLAGDETEWCAGIIEGVEGDTLKLRKGNERFSYALGAIRKARLDHIVEVEEAKNAI